jgi:hypothetical protein
MLHRYRLGGGWSGENLLLRTSFLLLRALFKQLGILSLESIIYLYKCSLLPASFLLTWVSNRERFEAEGAHNLRNEDDFQVPFARTNQLQRFPLVQIPTLWNNLPIEIKSVRNIHIFINSVKNILFSKLPDNPVCTRLFCPVCSQ